MFNVVSLAELARPGPIDESGEVSPLVPVCVDRYGICRGFHCSIGLDDEAMQLDDIEGGRHG